MYFMKWKPAIAAKGSRLRRAAFHHVPVYSTCAHLSSGKAAHLSSLWVVFGFPPRRGGETVHFLTAMRQPPAANGAFRIFRFEQTPARPQCQTPCRFCADGPAVIQAGAARQPYTSRFLPAGPKAVQQTLPTCGGPGKPAALPLTSRSAGPGGWPHDSCAEYPAAPPDGKNPYGRPYWSRAPC